MLYERWKCTGFGNERIEIDYALYQVDHFLTLCIQC